MTNLQEVQEKMARFTFPRVILLSTHSTFKTR